MESSLSDALKQQHIDLLQSLASRREQRDAELASSSPTPMQQQYGRSNGRLPVPLSVASRHQQRKSRSPSPNPYNAKSSDSELKLQGYGQDVYSQQEESLRNDLNMAYLNTGRRPQNMLQGVDLEERFSEYPKLAKLVELHSQLVAAHAHPPVYLNTDLSRDSFDLTSLLPTKFDCILIDPPLQEYATTYPGRIGEGSAKKRYWTWDEIANLPIPSITSTPGFIWLWVGSGKADDNGVSGLDKGREILAKWGYRRCEDIVWLRTNKRTPGLENEPGTKTLLTHTKEHCLMGIRGTVRRSTDSHFVHCNVDTDVIVWEGNENDPLHKPPELYNLIENFCLGTRRLELFGTSKNLRPGWLTIGEDVLPAASTDPQNAVQPIQYQKEFFDNYFQSEAEMYGANLVPTPAEIEALRPRSPGGAKSAAQLVPGVKSNPQGIGRHTNRSATPSASQQLELQKLQQKQSLPHKPAIPMNGFSQQQGSQTQHTHQQHDMGRQMAMQAQQQQQLEQQRQAEAAMMMQAMMQQQQAMNGGWQNPAGGMMGMMNGFSGPSQYPQMGMGMMSPPNMGGFPGQMGSPQAGFGMQIPQGYMGDMYNQQHMGNMMASQQMPQQQQQAMMGMMGQQAFGPGGQQFNNNNMQGFNNYGQGGFY